MVNRISGMYSGLDTDSIVKDLMKVEQMKVTKVERQKQLALWKQEAYTSTNKNLANFIINSRKNLGLSTTTSSGNVTINSYNYSRLDYVKKATSSNENVAKVSATAAAVSGSYQIEVNQLADSAKLSGKITSDNLAGVNQISFNLNGEIINVGDGSAQITLKDISEAINSSKTTGVTSFYDSSNDVIFIQSKETGSKGNINITYGDEDSKKFLSLLQGTDNEGNQVNGNEGSISVTGNKALVMFNGVELQYDSNNISLNGMNITLNSTAPGQKITIKNDINVDGIMEKVKQFITDYNTLVDQLSKSLNEEKFSSYYPLSADEKSAMNEEDIKLWTEKSKSGMLNRDETLNRVLQNIRTGLYENIEGAGAFNHITQIGISTESYARGTTGSKLQIDEEKLRNAILEDPESVMNLLFKEESEVEVTKNGVTSTVKSKGIVTNMFDNIVDGMKSIIDKSGPAGDADLYRNVKSNILLDFVTKKSSISDIDKSILEMNTKIDQLNTWLATKEESYYAKFTAMEKYMQQMSSQSSWLSQQG